VLSVCPLWSGCATQQDDASFQAAEASGASSPTSGSGGDSGSGTAGGAAGGTAGSGGTAATVTTSGSGGMMASAGTAPTAGSEPGAAGAGAAPSSAGAGGEGGADAGCNLPADCDDGNPCTTDSCLLKHCSYTANTTACADDKDPCTADVCAGGSCTHPDNKTCECKKDTDCDDKNVCTDDKCTTNKCGHSGNTLACADDGMACTMDICAASKCTHVPDGTCPIGTAFTVDSFNSGTDWTAGKTTPDMRTIVSVGADLTNLEGDMDLYVAASVTSTIEFGLASMVGLGKLRIVIRSAQANTGAMVSAGVWNGTTWTDKPLGNYAAIPTANYATIEVPTADFAQPLASLTKMRLSFAPTGGQKTWQIDEISAAK
jgi:hypothetical protein